MWRRWLFRLSRYKYTPETDNDDSLNETCIDTSRSGMKRCDLKHDNLDRFYYVYTPNNLDTNESIPVLFAFPWLWLISNKTFKLYKLFSN